ncbi:MAG: MFS transporter [Salinivirgaceae bacterium]|jgi:ACS family hexuronate transporter-like MFS transporter|nr:MFS transporter [Salinivirgaceae bacterium]
MKIKNFRWWIAALLMLATALNYLDRQNLPMVITDLRKIFPIDNVTFSQLNFMFLLAYGLMYIGGGKIIDWLGPKGGLVLMVAWWSAANMLHGLVAGVTGLFVARFLLGLGEGGGFPGAAKAVAEWFPPKERSFAFGLFNTGSSLGAMVAPPLIAFIVLSFSWRWVFLLTGLIGFVWVVVWYFVYEHPSKSRFVTSEEKTLIESSGISENSVKQNDFDIKWIKLFSYRQLWGLLSARFFIDSGWYFIIFWLPKYLADTRGLDIKEIGYYAWIPYACAGGGSLIGGWISSYLIKRNMSIDKSRKISLGIAAAMMPGVLFITSAPLSLAIVFFSMAMFGHQFFSTMLQTIGTDLFPNKVVGSVSGLAGSIGCFGAMFFGLLAGHIIQQVGYFPVFLMIGLMHPIGFLLILLIIKKIKMVQPLKTV